MSVVANRALPQGYKLHNYRIDRAISRGGFSIVYRAVDDNGTVVAIKEYLPSGLVLRSEGSRVHASSIENLDSFRFGMKCFFDEGKSLATINHPNVVRVLNFFRANETVYMVMKYERGRTLQQYIQGNQGMLPEGLIRHVFSRLLTGLREVHSRRLLHLDIKPANIYIRTDGSPVLLDFGAARQVLASRGSRVTPMYTPGFAAPEQYKEGDSERLGPWTDLYGVGASLFACFAAFAPQAADNANFTNNASYQVNWTADATAANAYFNASSGTVTQAIGAAAWILTNAYVVGRDAGTAPTLAQVGQSSAPLRETARAALGCGRFRPSRLRPSQSTRRP